MGRLSTCWERTPIGTPWGRESKSRLAERNNLRHCTMEEATFPVMIRASISVSGVAGVWMSFPSFGQTARFKGRRTC